MISDFTREETSHRNQLRPTKIADFIGQQDVVDLIEYTRRGAERRKSLFPHMLLSGPPGLGKTTLAEIVSSNKNLIRLVGGLVDTDTFLSTYFKCDVGSTIFIDEVHATPRGVLELFYHWMEDGFVADKSGTRLQPRPITLIAATTDTSRLPKPFVDRFEINAELEYYPEEDLVTILSRMQSKLHLHLPRSDLSEIAKRARGTPRIAGKYLRRVRDIKSLPKTWELLKVYENGLVALDLKVLHAMVNVFNGKAVGLRVLAASLGEDERKLREHVEPYLFKLGLLEMTPKGRKITTEGIKTYGLLYTER